MNPLLPRLVEPAPPSDDGLPYGAIPSAALEQGEGSDNLPRLLSASEVAALFNRSERTLRNWIRRDPLRPVRVGASLFFVEDDIRALVAGRLCHGILTDAQGRAGAGAAAPYSRRPMHP